MKGFHLTDIELNELRLAHRKARAISAPEAYKINAVILLGTGWKLKKVKEALLIDESTLRSYVDQYRDGGIDLLISTNYQGSQCRLSDDQLKKLSEELNSSIYLTTKAVINFVYATFQKTYSLSGMRDLLQRMGYVYKKPKLVPGNPDKEAQELFAEQYEKFMETKSANAESTINLLQTIEQKYFVATEIVLILDNARYHYSKEVKAYLVDSKIRLVFLPSYSPNLNPIERLWKYFKKVVLYNTYYESLKQFRRASISFFKNIDEHLEELAPILQADFNLT